MLALGATIVTNKREIAADKFFNGLFETALKEGEIVTAVTFTAPAKAGYAKFRNPASRYAMIGVFVAKGKDGVRVGGDRAPATTACSARRRSRRHWRRSSRRRRWTGVKVPAGQPDERHPRLGRTTAPTWSW